MSLLYNYFFKTHLQKLSGEDSDITKNLKLPQKQLEDETKVI